MFALQQLLFEPIPLRVRALDRDSRALLFARVVFHLARVFARARIGDGFQIGQSNRDLLSEIVLRLGEREELRIHARRRRESRVESRRRAAE